MMADETPSATETLIDKVIESADHAHEKAWWQSKKFVAFLATELGFFTLMGAMIFEQEMDQLGENVAFMVLAVTAGFLAVGYILGQAYIDKYIRVAKITMGRGNGDGNGNGDDPKGEE
jgi:hypothetical protein